MMQRIETVVLVVPLQVHCDLITKVMAGNGHQRAIVIPADVRQSGEDPGRKNMTQSFSRLWSQDDGQDVAEYSVMLAVVLVIALGTIRMIGSSAKTVFSRIGSAIPLPSID